jgi:hypothetical protein
MSNQSDEPQDYVVEVLVRSTRKVRVEGVVGGKLAARAAAVPLVLAKFPAEAKAVVLNSWAAVSPKSSPRVTRTRKMGDTPRDLRLRARAVTDEKEWEFVLSLFRPSSGLQKALCELHELGSMKYRFRAGSTVDSLNSSFKRVKAPYRVFRAVSILRDAFEGREYKFGHYYLFKILPRPKGE